MESNIKVTIDGIGVFFINPNALSKLITLLNQNNAVKIDNTIKEIQNNEFTGRSLINEG